MDSYRAVLEVLKLTSPKDVLEHTCLASKAWQRVSGSAELWLSHSDSSQLSPACTDPAGFKLIYRQCFCQAEVLGGKVEVYNALTGNWWKRDLQETTMFEAHSAGCWLADGQVFVCGGGSPATKKAAIVDVETGLVRSLQDMSRERAEHAAVYHNDQVYVFSGYANGVIRSCEKLSLASGDWTPLPNSPDGIVNSSPCVHQSTVYLCGIEFHTFLQFSLATDSFIDTRLKVRVEGSVKCCVAYEDCVVIIARGAVWKWKIGAETADTKKASALSGGWWGCMRPVLLGSEVVLATESEVKRMDLETLQCRVDLRSIMADDPASSVFLRSLLAGGASGLAVDLALFPLDSLKTRWQAGSGLHLSRPYSGLLSTSLASFPCAATFWATYNCVKRVSRSHEWSPAVVHIISASCGGIATSVVRNPFEVVKQQLQLEMHTSAVPAVRTILRQGGVQGLFAGLVPLVGREVPFDVLQFLIYEYLKSEDYGGAEKPVSTRLWCGAVAGGCAALLTNPIDVVKTRLMTQSRSTYPSTVGAFRVIYRREGLKAFWTGWQLRLLYTAIGGTLFFGTFEAINTVLLPYI